MSTNNSNTNKHNNAGTKYEKQTIEQLGLKPYGRRSNKYRPDAFIGEKEHFFEIKSCNLEKGKISTGRDVSHKKIDEWRKVHWIFSGRVGGKIVNHVLVVKENMEPIYKKFEEKINTDGKTYAGLNQKEMIAKSLRDSGVSEEQITKICNTYRRGTNLNDPRINWSEVEQLGTFVENLQDVKRVLGCEEIKEEDFMHGVIDYEQETAETNEEEQLLLFG